MPTDQYHEPPDELSPETRTDARIITALIEEAEAIGWYTQRISVEKDAAAKAIMQNAMHEEFKHFGMDLEFLLRKMPIWRETLQTILFQEGDIVELGELAEQRAGSLKTGGDAPAQAGNMGDESLGVGGLKGDES
jgi:hypothetical protein